MRQNVGALDSAIQRIFAAPTQETQLTKARRIIGDSLSTTSDEELEIYLTELQHLIDSWLDCFEREVFDGETLKQLLGQG